MLFVRVIFSNFAFRYSLSVLKIYSARYVYYRLSVLAVNIETQPLSRIDSSRRHIWIKKW